MIKRVLSAFLCLLLTLVIGYVSVNNSKHIGVSTSTPVTNIRRVIIDAGHGGFDGGAVASDGTIEKDLNLAIALKLDVVLRSLGFETILVRSEDVSTASGGDATHSQKVNDIKNRLKLTEKYKDAIFVSIHMNKYSTSQPHGAQVFHAKVDGSKELAECIQSALREYVQPDNKRVVKMTTKDIYLLNNAVIPSVIAECGFLSNASDLKSLKDEGYQLKTALAISSGIVDYFTVNDN